MTTAPDHYSGKSSLPPSSVRPTRTTGLGGTASGIEPNPSLLSPSASGVISRSGSSDITETISDDGSGLSNTPYTARMSSYHRDNEPSLTVARMATIIGPELKGHTFKNVDKLPYVLFPKLPFTFDDAKFTAPETKYRKTHFRASILAIPDFIKEHFKGTGLLLDDETDTSKGKSRASVTSFQRGRPFGVTTRSGRSTGGGIELPEEEEDDEDEDDENEEAEEDEEDEGKEDEEEEEEVKPDDEEEDVSSKDEEALAAWLRVIVTDLNTLAKTKFSVRFFKGDFHKKPLTGATADKRKPDVVLIDVGHLGTHDIPDGHWAHILIVIEVSWTSHFPTKLKNECSQRAALMLHNNPGRRFVPILAISGREFMLFVFHRSGVSMSQHFDFVLEEYTFYYIIAGFAFCSLDYLGFDPAITLDKATSLPKQISFGNRNLGVIGKARAKEGIQGRGTVVFIVYDLVTEEVFVLKLVWLLLKEMSEIDFLNRTKARKIKGVPVIEEVEDCQWTNRRRKDRTALWMPDKNIGRYPVRQYRKLLMHGVGVPIEDFNSKFELLSGVEDILLILKALRGAGILHRDMSLRNMYLINEYPEYPADAETSEPASVASKYTISPALTTSSTVAGTHERPDPTEAEMEQVFGTSAAVRRGFVADFDNACLTQAGAAEKASVPSDVKANKKGLRTGTLGSMPIQVLLGYTIAEDGNFYYTLQMDLESILYDLLHICIHRSGPHEERRITKVPPPAVYNDTADIPTRVWEYKGMTLVQLGMLKVSTYIHMKEGVLPWIDPYFNDMKDFFAEYADALFPKGMPKEHYDKRVCSTADIDELIKIVRKYKNVVQEPMSSLTSKFAQVSIKSSSKGKRSKSGSSQKK